MEKANLHGGNMKPYEDTKVDNHTFKRVFKKEIPEKELVWHRDANDRHIRVVSGKWQFQFDNEVPFEIYEGLHFFIPKNEYHRIIKGDGDLVLEITESNRMQGM